MLLESFDQYFNFRNKCFCGGKLYDTFTYSTYIDEFVSIKPRGAFRIDKANRMITFAFNLASTVAPYGDVDFSVIADIDKPTFTYRIDANIRPEIDLITPHFNDYVQRKLDIRIIRRCYGSESNTGCGAVYQLTTSPIIFAEGTKKTLLSLRTEQFRLHLNGKVYRFCTDFEKMETELAYLGEKYRVTYHNILKMSAEKFLNIPFEREALTNKLKTILLFM